MIKSLLTFNGYVDKVNDYGQDNANLEKSRLAVFDIVRNNELKKASRVYQGHMPVDTAKNGIGEEIMSLDEIVDKGTKLNNAIQDGWVYTLDTETFGVTDEQLDKEISRRIATGHPDITPDNIKAIKEVNHNAHVMTEFYMSKQYYQNGKAMKMVDGKWVEGIDRIEVFRVTNSKDVGVMKELLQVARNTKGAGDLLFNLGRAAGAYGDGIYENDYVKYPSTWNPNGDIFDANATHGGLVNLEKHAKAKYGTEGFKNQAQELYNIFSNVVNDGTNSIFETLNGEEFDWPVIFNYFDQAGVKVDDGVRKKIMAQQVDAQKLIAATGFKNTIYNDLNNRKDQLMDEAVALYKSGDTAAATAKEAEADKIALGITNSSIAQAAQSRGVQFPVDDTHVARADVAITQSGLEVYHQPLLDRIEELKGQAKRKVGPNSSTLFTANRAIVFDRESDIYFSNTFGPDGNTYNAVGMEAGHTYKLNVYNNVEDFKIDGVDTKGKKILEMEDQYEYTDGTKRKSYLLIDSDKEIQSRILDTGNVEAYPESKINPENIRRTTENALRDKARVERANWFSVNSDKGFKSFETYLGIYDDITTGIGSTDKKDIINELSVVNSNEKKEQLKAIAPGLFSTKKGYENNIIQERVSNFINLFDDLKDNHGYYSFLKEAVDNKVGSIAKFAEDSGIGTSNEYVLNYEYNKVKTAALYQAKHNLDDEMFNYLDDDKIIERYYLENQNAVINAKTESHAKQLMNSGLPEKEALAAARKDMFEDNFNFSFNKKDKGVQEAILGYTAVEKDSRMLNTLDLMGDKGKYSRIRTDSISNIEKDIDNLLNINAIKSKSLDGRNVARERYLKNVVNELRGRNIISSNDYKNIMKNQNINPYQRATLLSEAIYESKKQVEVIAKRINGNKSFAENVLNPNGLDYSLVEKDDADKLKNYLEKMHMSVIKAPDNNVETYLGMNKSEMVKGKLSNELMENITKGIENLTPGISTFRPGDVSKHDEIKAMLMNKLNYTENNANLFINGVLNNKANESFTYAKSGKEVKGGVANLLKIVGEGEDAQAYLLTMPKNQQHKIEQMLLEQDRYGFDIDELKKNAMVYKMDKVTEGGDGIRYIKSSNAAGKAITQNVVASSDWQSQSFTYEIRDTLDKTLISFSKNQYERGLKEMALGNLEKANSIVNWSRREINENKSRSSTVLTYEQGKGFIKKQKLNVADAMLNRKMDLTDMVYSLDTVLEGSSNELRDSLVDAIGETNVNGLLKKIAKFKAKPWKSNALTFEGLDTGAKLWFALNTDKIADKLMSNKTFMDRNSGMESLLKTMKEHGTSLFYSKESGEAFKGIINMDPTHMYVAGASLSGASRPLINQVLNSKPMTVSDMQMLSKNTLGLELNSAKEIEEAFDIKFGRSWMTKDLKNIEELSSSQGFHQGFSAKIKYMNAKDFADRINEMSNITGDEKWVKDLMSKHQGLKLSQVKKMVEGIGNVTSIYEDSGAIDPALSRIFEQRGVVTETLDNDKVYKIGSTYKGKEILGQDGRKLYLQNKQKYFDIKVAFGYSEKAELHAYNARNSREALIASEVFKQVSGGASIIMDPNLAKHEAFNSMFTLYSNAITNNIKTDEDLKVVNDILKNHFGSLQDIRVEQLSSGRYSLIEGVKNGKTAFNGVDLFQSVINDLKNKNKTGSYAERFAGDIANIETANGIGYGDFSLMSDNTIEKPFENGRGGAKINYRSQQAIGIFIGDDPDAEIMKYREAGAGYDKTNPLQALIDSDINQLLKDTGENGFVSKMKQSANIGAALMHSDLHSIDRSTAMNRYIDKDLYGQYDAIAAKTRVVELDLEQAITRVPTMTGETLPEAFKDVYKKNPVNVYKVKLNNMTLANPMYQDLLENRDAYGINDVEEYAEKHGIKKRVSEIYIPAMKPNTIDKVNDVKALSKVQREASDLMNILYDIQRGTYGGKTLGALEQEANDKLKSYSDTLRFELTDSDGFYKKSLNIRSKNSARFKVANIGAPVADDSGRYVNSFFRDRATRLVDGKVEYRAVQAVNPSDIFGDDVARAYKNIGRQLMSGEIDSSKEALELIKKYKGSKEWAKIGQDYLENVGFNSLIMRDPAMLSTSYQTARTYVSNKVTKGSTWIDAVSAKWMNADGDGDEINGYYHMLEERKGKGYYLRKEADDISKALMKDISNRQNANKNLFDKLTKDYLDEITKAKTDNVRILGDYNKHFFGEGGLRLEDFKDGGKINVDYIHGKSTVIPNLLSRFLKGSIGQVSNPNYYLKTATAYYTGSRGYSDANLYKLQRNIQMLTDTTEQSLIDVKSIKSLDDANAIARIASSYRMNMDNIAYLGDSKKMVQARLASMEEMIAQAGKILNEKKGLEVVGDSEFFFGKSKEAILARNEMAARIIKQDRSYLGNYKSNSVEEVLMDTYKVLSDTNANKLFFDSTIRQTDLKYLNGRKLTDIEKTHRALGAIGLGSDQSGKAKIFRESNALHYIQQMPVINDKIVFLNDILHSSNIDGNMAPGVYRVKSIFTDKNGDAALKLIDLGNKKKNQIVVSARNFNNLSNVLKDYDVSDSKYTHASDIVADTKRSLRKAYEARAIESLEGANQVFNQRTGKNSSLQNQALNRIRQQFDKGKVEEFLIDIEIIKNNKLASNEELAAFRKQMNDTLRRKGGKDYRATRKDAMLNFSRVKQLGITSGTFDKWDAEKFSGATREATKIAYFYQKDLDKIKDRPRYNIDEMRQHLNESFNDILKDKSYEHLDADTVSMIKQGQLDKMINDLAANDADTHSLVKDIYARNMNNPEFKKNILHLNLSHTLDNIKQPQQLMDTLAKTVISYGEYAGYSIEQLGLEKASRVLSKDYMVGIKESISEDIREETEKIIIHMKNLSGKNGIIEPSPGEYVKKQLASEQGDYLANIRKELNEEIRRKGAAQKESTGKFAMSNILDKAKTAWRDMSPGKQKMVAGGAIGAIALGALALGMSGSNTLHADSGNYKKENRDADRVKVREPQSPQTSYSDVGQNDSVPMSDSRFYSNQNQGLAVKVSGDAPEGASPEHANGLLERVFGGSQASISTSYNDSRQNNSDREVDEAMSNATLD